MTEYKSFQEILEDIDNDKNPIAQDVWNAAIEKAALSVDDEYSNVTVNKALAAEAIRKLKVK